MTYTENWQIPDYDPIFFIQTLPYSGNLSRDLVANFLIGLFVALFLIVFQPFGTNLWETDHKFLKLAGRCLWTNWSLILSSSLSIRSGYGRSGKNLDFRFQKSEFRNF